jgi:hypothetical protein
MQRSLQTKRMSEGAQPPRLVRLSAQLKPYLNHPVPAVGTLVATAQLTDKTPT